MSIVVIGTTFVDIKGHPESTFIKDGRNSGSIKYIHGGVARNVAEDIANCGLKPVFISAADQSPLTRDILEHLEFRGIDTRYVRTTEDGLGTWLAIFDNAGDVVSSISKRPDLSGIVEVLQEQGDEIFSQADTILLELDADEPIPQLTFDLAEKHKKEVYALVSNMSIALERPEYLKRISCFICNEQEAGMMFKTDLTMMSIHQIADVMRKGMPKYGLRRLVVTLGPAGAVYADLDSNEFGHVPAHEDVKVVDTTGAGDSFFAGVSIGLTNKTSLKKACEIGTTLSESVIARNKNVCRKQKLEDLLG